MPASDGTLLERWIARRDAEAFNEIVTRHADLVYGVCRRVARNDADAEDLAQDCFLKLAAVPCVPRSSLAGWLHTVATRTALDLLRARSRRRDRERRFAEARAREGVAAPTWVQLQEHVDASIAELPEELREVIVAHFLERKTHEAVAMALGVSRQTVTHRIARGVERLRLLLKKRGVTATGAALAGLLGDLPLEAAPAGLLASLGRLVLAGPPPGAVAASSSVLLTIAKVEGFIVAKKLLISGLAALAFVLLAGFTAFRGLPDRVDPIASRPAPAPLPPGKVPAPGAAAAAGRRSSRERTESASAGGAAQLPANALAGKVLDVEGQPVGEAKVVAAAGPPGRAEKLAETTSDEAGRFRIAPVEGEEVVVWSFKRGVGLGASSAGPAALEVILEPLCEVSGRFHDRETGEGIAGLTVRLSARDASGASSGVASLHSRGWKLFPELGAGSAAITGAEGRYVLEVPPVRSFFQFDANASEYVLPGHRIHDAPVEVLLVPGERRSGVDFALEKGGSVAGTVFGPGEQALPGVRVEILASHLAPFQRSIQSDLEGSYRFTGLAPGATYVISASRDGLSPGESPAVAIPEADGIEGVDIHLVLGHAVHGRLLDGLGRPAAGIGIALAKVFESDRMIWAYGGTATGDDGSFSFSHVAAGKHAVRASSPQGAEEVFTFTMPGDRDLSGLEFMLRGKAPGFISGRVVDHAGNPVAGFPVAANIGLKTAGKTLSGEDGAFRLEGLAEADAYVIVGYSGDYWSARQLSVPLYSTDVTLVAIRRGRIQGRVIEAGTGRPVEHFEVRAVFIRTEPDGGENRFHLKWTPFDSRTGEFLIERAEPVEAMVQVRAEGYAEARSPRFTIPPGDAPEEVVIALSRGSSVHGTVLDAETGEPLPGALLRAHQQEAFFPWLLQEGKESYAPRGVWELTMSRADGGFAFSGLAPGDTVQLVAWKEGYGPSVRAGVKAGQEGEALRISLGRAAAILISARFRPRAGERFEFHALHRQARPWRAAFRASSAAERPGTVEVSGLPPGPYRLAVYSAMPEGAGVSRRLLGEERLEVAPGERHEVLLDLDDLGRRFASISGRVAGGIDPGGIQLRIVAGEDPEESYAYGSMLPGPDGSFSFTGLPAGKYAIVARSVAVEPAVETRLSVEVRDGQRLEVELPFK